MKKIVPFIILVMAMFIPLMPLDTGFSFAGEGETEISGEAAENTEETTQGTTEEGASDEEKAAEENADAEEASAEGREIRVWLDKNIEGLEEAKEFCFTILDENDCIPEDVDFGIPEYEGYKFIGWYYQSDCAPGSEFNYKNPVKSDEITLYAKWKDCSAVTYMDEDGNEKTCTEYEYIDSEHTSFSSKTTKWLVFDEDCTDLEKLELTGFGSNPYNIILKDGATVNIKKSVSIKDASLAIYCQKAGTGKLVVHGEGVYGDAVIGSIANSRCGEVKINGGIIEARGGSFGAVIGGGQNGTLYRVIINGGTITATSTYDGPAIGLGAATGGNGTYGTDVIINGGVINAKADNGAAIGMGGNGGGNPGWFKLLHITINGGTINAHSQDGAGIGMGRVTSVKSTSKIDKININGGTITAVSERGQGIGYGSNKNGCVIDATGVAPSCSVLTGPNEETAVPADDISNTGKYVHVSVSQVSLLQFLTTDKTLAMVTSERATELKEAVSKTIVL